MEIITKEQIIGENKLSHQEKVEMFERILMSTNRTGIENVIGYLRNTDFYTAPASSRFHSNYDGGLLDHVLLVYSVASQIFNSLKNIDDNIKYNVSEEGLIISTLLHDVCKVCLYRKTTKYKKDETNTWITYDGYELDDVFPIGHGEKSVIILQSIGFELQPCEMLAIRYHMGFWGDDNKDVKSSQTTAIQMCPLVVILQSADFMASNILELTIKN